MSQHANDLLSQGVGAKKQEEEKSSDSTKSPIGHTAHDKLSAGEDLLSDSGSEKVEKSEEKSVKNEDTSSKKVESKKDEVDLGDTDPNSWTLENSLKELKKTREEAKNVRVKYQEKLKQKEEEFASKMSTERQKYEEAMQAAKELEEMKPKEADKKRTLEERLAHREKVIAEREQREREIEENYRAKLEAADNRIKELEAEREAQNQVYKERLEEELNRIPEEKREIATLITKGAGADPRDQLIALNEASLKGIFDEKKVVVNHSVPGAKDGARVTQKQLDEAERERRAKMSPQQKIREGLKGRQSTPKMGKNSII